VALATCCSDDRLQCLLVHKALLGHTPVYIADLLTLGANISARSSLRASVKGDAPRTRRRIGDKVLSVTAAGAWNRLPTELTVVLHFNFYA